MAPGVDVAVIQHDIVWEDRDATLSRLAPMVAAAASSSSAASSSAASSSVSSSSAASSSVSAASASGARARLVVLTEMFSVGFSPRTERIEEAPDGASTEFLSTVARVHGVWAVGSVCMRRPGLDLPQNVAVLAGPDGSVHHYAKRHLFSYAGEHERMSSGGPTLTVDIDGLRTTVFVCYDLRFADDFWRLAPDTDAYVVVANWPAARRHHWRSLLVARAIENQAWVVAANRVGVGGRLEYSGDSLVIDPMGEVVADGAGGAETVLRAVLDPRQVAAVRARYPFLDDRGVPVPLAADEH